MSINATIRTICGISCIKLFNNDLFIGMFFSKVFYYTFDNRGFDDCITLTFYIDDLFKNTLFIDSIKIKHDYKRILTVINGVVKNDRM